MISVQEAEEKILSRVGPLGAEERSLQQALGLYLAKEVVAPVSLPPFNNSAMDGYAVRSGDLSGATVDSPCRLNLVGECPAGSWREDSLQLGQAVQIATGAPVPPGADTVVILEEAKRRDGFVIVDHPVPAGRHIRRQGEEIQVGETVLAKATRIRPAEIALLAGLGFSQVKVFRPPSVAILVTGSELVGADQPLRPGALWDSNSWVLVSYLKSLGVPTLNLGIVPDEEKAVLQAFQEAAQCDVILSSGGVSVGEHDLVKKILIKEFDFKTIFWRVRMKPGKPLLFGLLNGKPLFGLPGNPISCAVCFLRFIAPALRKMMGDPNPHPAVRKAVLGTPLSVKEAGKTHFVTARIEFSSEPPLATPTSHQGSGMLTSMTEGNALIVVPEEVRELPVGTFVEVIPDD